MNQGTLLERRGPGGGDARAQEASAVRDDADEDVQEAAAGDDL